MATRPASAISTQRADAGRITVSARRVVAAHVARMYPRPKFLDEMVVKEKR